MRTVDTDIAHSAVCALTVGHTGEEPSKLDKPIVTPFGASSGGASRATCGIHTGATWQIRLIDPCAVALMQAGAPLRWPFVFQADMAERKL